MSIYLCQNISVQNFQYMVVHWEHAKASLWYFLFLIVFPPSSSKKCTVLIKHNCERKTKSKIGKNPWKNLENGMEKMDIYVLFLILEDFLLLTVQNDINCEFVIHSFYYIEICYLSTHFDDSFNYEWMLNFDKCFFACLLGQCHFFLVLLMWWLICECWIILASME